MPQRSAAQAAEQRCRSQRGEEAVDARAVAVEEGLVDQALLDQHAATPSSSAVSVPGRIGSHSAPSDSSTSQRCGETEISSHPGVAQRPQPGGGEMAVGAAVLDLLVLGGQATEGDQQAAVAASCSKDVCPPSTWNHGPTT